LARAYLMNLPAFVAVAALLSNASLAAESTIIAPGHKLQKLAGGFEFTEGPACDPQGNILFTDQPNDRILKWSVEAKLSTFMQPCGRANGLCFDRQGKLWACADEKNELWLIGPGSNRTVVLKDYKQKLFNGPNDVWVAPGGGIYFTDPYYSRPYWSRGPREMDPGVYYLSADLKNVVRIVDDLKQPNGIIGSKDGTVLYVADIGAGKTYEYRVQGNGSVGEKKLFCELGSDGMTIDNEGNVYLTGKGVSVFNSKGTKIEHIDVPEPWTANVCFGGRSRDLLFITASKAIYGLQMRVKGVNSQ